jgi:uncharacterized 2Fe-2S/4Fe-4S cluster protein (DUF4445 family)
VTVTIDEPDMETPRGDIDRLREALAKEAGLETLAFDPCPAAEGFRRILRKGHWQVTAAIHRDISSPATVVALWPGEKQAVYGLAVDIGSTTIAAHLCDLRTAHGLLRRHLQPADPLRRRPDVAVSYVQMNPTKLPDLVKAVREAINALVGKLVGDVGAERADVLDATFVGNPVMHHLFLGIDPVELGGAPFALAAVRRHGAEPPVILTLISIRAPGSTCCRVSPAMWARMRPRPRSPKARYSLDEITLLVDVGTNAEIVLGNKDRLLAASSPTGPAFEGAEISSGQRAAPGAIERIRIDKDTLEPRFKVIGVDEWSDEDGFSRRSTVSVSPAFAAPASSRRSRKCISPASSPRTA